MIAVDEIKTRFANRCSSKTGLVGTLVSAGILATMFATGSANAQSVAFGGADQYSDSLTRKFYGGIGFGASRLEPDTSRVEGVDPNDRVHAAGQIMLGVDLNKWLSIEGHAASLGDAGLSPSGELSYQTIGLSALAYVGKNRHRYNRRGISAFGRIGGGYLDNEASDGLEFEQVNAGHFLIGAGLEYSTRMGLAIRAEAISFDEDIQYGQFSVLYRLGKRRARRPQQVVRAPEPVIEQAPVEAVVPVPAVTVAAAPADSDFDGVYDDFDQCPNSLSGEAVDASGCALFNGVIEGVNFDSGSAQLTPSAQGVLSGVVTTLNQFPSTNISIMAHTDSQGAADANKDLSRQRARSVAKYLVQNGIGVERLSAFGFGEEQPIDSNETADGRLRNRRVEFRAQ